jgi:hypothetical protein
MTFLVRGESVISLGDVVESPRPMMNSTAVRTFESSTPRESRTRAAHQTEEEMLRSYVVMVETDRLVLGKREDSLGAVVEAVKRSHLLRLLKVYRRV